MLGTGGAIALARPAVAQQAWPSRPVEVVVGFAPGGSTDVLARILSPFLEAEIPGLRMTILNRPGAGGETAYVALQSARPDGYTLGFVNTPGFLSLPVERRVRYDPDQIRPIARLVDDPAIFAVGRDSPFRGLADVVAQARRDPESISVGTPGIGTGAHLGVTLFEAAAGIKLIHVPYAGAGPAKTALLAQHVQIACMGLSELSIGGDRGMLRTLASMSDASSEMAPGVATFREQGFDVLMTHGRGLAVPRGVPDDIVSRLSDALRRVMSNPAWLEKARQIELPLSYETGEAWHTEMRIQEVRLRRIWDTTPWR
ncbi:tripartite tricarboxylate transporter substrate binding protein [Humitalea sp. 24SJ18S-53]|uniref:tripartite tricarboxylate transporter substrate binding protein n=1 Tax=Humitalea sp. 24SJ18S-53 TaxID=3422307 RepID=UPI003D6787BC